RAANVVRGDAVRVEMAGRAVDEDESGARPLLDVEIRMVVTRRDNDDPVDAAVAKRFDQLALAAWVLVAAPGEDEHVPGARGILDRTVERRRERVGDVLEDEPDRLRLPPEPPEHRRVCIASVV